MKTFITFIILLVVGLTACTENSDFITQDSGFDNQSLEKKHKDKNIDPPEDYYTASKVIDGKKGGKITLKVSMDPSTGQKSEVKLDIPRGAFEGEQEISFYITPNEPCIVFSPHGLEFKKELQLDLKLENFWFDKKDNKDLNFVYADDLGNILEQVEYDKLKLDHNKNFVQVKGAKIPHFSRYVFMR